MARLCRAVSVPPRTSAAGFLGLLVLLIGGCARLNHEQTFEFTSPEIRHLEWDPPKYKQDLTITISAEQPVNAYLVKAEDKDKTIQDLGVSKKPENVLDSKEDAKEITLTGTTPAGIGGALVIQNPTGKNKVQVKIVGR
jgi:hypothetical protein